ncbi:hypothetical protein AQUCO_04400061v1 [Aquilegia coerulea]|uniref:Uncharacterized protein n=1 Tax=Aquilegia coerulea TaxID=218851 RepID=A0A2G5CMT4_AQUCA|nr:hypothetical protein AQUCO_04400061v1 [Aquilegia coerulea]
MVSTMIRDCCSTNDRIKDENESVWVKILESTNLPWKQKHQISDVFSCSQAMKKQYIPSIIRDDLIKSLYQLFEKKRARNTQ